MLYLVSFKAAVDLHQTSQTWDSGQIYIIEKDFEGYNKSRLLYAHEIATQIEEEWLAGKINVGSEKESRGLMVGEDWPLNITDFIHIYGQGNPASFLVEVARGPGTTKKMQKRIALSAIQSTINHVLDNI